MKKNKGLIAGLLAGGAALIGAGLFSLLKKPSTIEADVLTDGESAEEVEFVEVDESNEE